MTHPSEKSRSKARAFARMGAVAVPLLLAASSRATPRDEPVTVVTHVDVLPDAALPGAERRAARLFRAERAASRRDAGCAAYAVFREVRIPNHLTVVETWRDARAYARHAGSPHTVRFRREIQPFLGSPYDARPNRRLP